MTVTGGGGMEESPAKTNLTLRTVRLLIGESNDDIVIFASKSVNTQSLLMEY